MTMDEFIEKRRKQLSKIVEKNEPLKIAVLDIAVAQSQRIFIEGQNSSDGAIGQYDTKRPMYVNPNTSAGAAKGKGRGKFPTEGLTPTRGKTGEHKFKNGNEHKTTYVQNYKDFRNRIGRRIDRVNLSLSNDMQSDFSSLKVIGAPHNPVKISPHEYHLTLKRDGNEAKKLGLEKKYGEIFKLSPPEKKRFYETVNKELQRVFAD